MEKKADVVVVGGGMSGLVAIKSCLEENLDVICYEKYESIGGNWKFRDEGLSCMKSTTLNVSKELMAFSDFPFPAEAPNFQRCDKYMSYLESYAAHFDLIPRIRCNHEVLSIEPGPEFHSKGNWTVTVRDAVTDTRHKIIASNIILCVGQFTKPHLATFPGLDTFKGQVMHTCEYKQPNGFDGKKILIVGQGNSAYDAAVELGYVADKVYCTVKPGVLVITRMGHNGYPYDIITFSRFNFTKYMYCSSAMGKDLMKKCVVQRDHDLYGLPVDGFRPDAHILTISDQLPYSILAGRIAMQNPVERFTSNGVVFQGSPTEHPIDVVVMATGYEMPEFPFFKHGELTQRDIRYGLFKRVFPVKFEHQTIAVICSARFDSSNATFSELQSRWVAAVFSKRAPLPPKDVMKHEVETGFGNPSYSTLATDSKLPVLFPLPYYDDVAKFIGAKPNFFLMFFTDPRLFMACMFGPLVSYQYRLVGPHSWSKARETILTVPQRVKAGFGSRTHGQNDRKCLHSLVKHTIFIGLLGAVLYNFHPTFSAFIQQNITWNPCSIFKIHK